MSALGYWEGRDVTLDVPWAEGVAERFPRLVAGVTALRPDVIVVAWTPGAIAAKREDPNNTEAITIAIRHNALRASALGALCTLLPHPGSACAIVPIGEHLLQNLPRL
jgi:hypothetical protein